MAIVNTLIDGNASVYATLYANSRNMVRTTSGRIWVVYTNASWNIEAAYSDDDGATWAYELVSGTKDNQFNPSIAVDSEDNIHVVWVGAYWGVNTQKYNVRYRMRGDNWGAQEAITDVAYDQYYPNIAIDSNDDVHVVWEGLGVGTYPTKINILYRKKESFWQAQEELTDVNGNQELPMIAIDSNDYIHLVWYGKGQGGNPSNYNIIYRKYTTSWQAQEAITDVAHDQYQPQIALDSSDQPHVVWYGLGWGVNTTINNIQYRYKTDTWQAQENVSDNTDEQYYPAISLDGSDNIYVVWTGDGQGSNPTAENIMHRKKSGTWGTAVCILDDTKDKEYASLCWNEIQEKTTTGYEFVYTDVTDANIYYYASTDLDYPAWTPPPPSGEIEAADTKTATYLYNNIRTVVYRRD